MSEHLESAPRPDLRGLRVISFESRRAREVELLLTRQGADALSAPSMREVPEADEAAAVRFGQSLQRGACDILVLLTGVGTQMLVDTLTAHWPRATVLEWLHALPLACRGPKPVATLKQLGLTPAVVAPSPNTFRELLSALDEGLPVAGKRVTVQEYGVENADLYAGLRSRGAEVTGLRVYHWALPEDTGPLEEALRCLARAEADAAVFTSAHQVDNVLGQAEALGVLDAVLKALRERTLVASVGPVTSRALEARGIAVDLAPESPKMGPLIISLARQARALIRGKHAGSPHPATPEAGR